MLAASACRPRPRFGFPDPLPTASARRKSSRRGTTSAAAARPPRTISFCREIVYSLTTPISKRFTWRRPTPRPPRRMPPTLWPSRRPSSTASRMLVDSSDELKEFVDADHPGLVSPTWVLGGALLEKHRLVRTAAEAQGTTCRGGRSHAHERVAAGQCRRSQRAAHPHPRTSHRRWPEKRRPQGAGPCRPQLGSAITSTSPARSPPRSLPWPASAHPMAATRPTTSSSRPSGPLATLRAPRFPSLGLRPAIRRHASCHGLMAIYASNEGEKRA